MSIKVRVEYIPDNLEMGDHAFEVGITVTEIKGATGGTADWIKAEVETNAGFDENANITIDWSQLGLPGSLRKRLVICIGGLE